jgi:uncharacterized protein (TIGR03083 family)
MSMDLHAYLALLAAEATSLAIVAEEAGLDASVPTCPGWSVTDLVLHVGEVHRWATAAVASRATRLGDVPSDSRGALPERADTIAWLRDGAAKLCETLAIADPSVEYAAFLADPPTPRLLFWARRQTMETGVHRVDAESAVGRRTPFAPEVAIDGIDEFLTGFLPRSRTPLRTDVARTLRIVPEYTVRQWTVSLSAEMPVTTRGLTDTGTEADSDVDCVVSGPASDLFLALWNRAPLDTLTIEGDRGVFDLLRDEVQIRWG